MGSSLKVAGLLLVIAFFAYGCVGATPYGPAEGSFTGGFSETKLQNNVYNVSFVGNGFISHEQAKNYLFFRCAELTVQNGYDYFVITSGESNTNFAVVGYSTVAKPNYTSTIKMGKGSKPENAMDARELMKNLEPKIKRAGS